VEAAVNRAECFKKYLLESCIFFMGQQFRYSASCSQ
jgi:hypothetical protein